MPEPEKTQNQTPPETHETPQDYDPLLQQAERLPDFIKGSEGETKHVRDVGDDGEPVEDDEDLEDPFGYEPPDPSQFTGD